MSAPMQAEDPFADLADSLPPPSATSSQSKDDGQGYIWKAGNQQDDDPLTLMAADQHNVAPAPPPTKIKILKRRNTTDRKAEGTTTVTPTTEDLESRAKEKELEYQRARERILGNDADALLTANVTTPTPPQRSTTNSPSGSGAATPPGNINGYQGSAGPGTTQASGSESFTSAASTTDPAGGSISIHSTRGKQRSPINNATSDMEQEDMSEYRRMPVAYVPTSNPMAPGYAAIPYTPAPGHAHSAPNPYAAAQASIGYVHLAGIPAYPIPPPPPMDQLRSMHLPKPRNPPPFPIYPPASNTPPPFVLFPIAGASPAGSANASRTGSPAFAAGARTSPARSGSATSNSGAPNAAAAFVASDATAGTAAGLLERQMAGMQLGAGAQQLPQYMGPPGPHPQAVYTPPARGGYNGGMGRGAPGTAGQQQYPQYSQQQQQQQQQQQGTGGADVRRSRSGASNRGRGRLWKPSS
ncbi:hypothetical protein BCR44DRAFT_1435428 [Catenaria anguillulae PL171]|uniref:SUZ domain-containing protein n=1 Tax=Catenaria anguillulae PL171 TaxID=765915 RepID=A0A1Y2HK21_9FUNG|nr:hypothetical protein BCR44DRAFT_1435428 [Catenaria anguillulae PL171]